MRKIATQLMASVTLLLTILFSHNSFAQPSTVTLPGSFQTEYGCAIWEPNCDAVRLTETSGGIWEGTFNLPAGYWEFKVAYNNSWNENYGQYGIPGGPNIPLNLTGPATVQFRYSESTHLVDISFPTPPDAPAKVILAGDFQSEVGCPGDWQPDCTATRLYYDAGTELYKGTFRLPDGQWAFKVTVGGSWNENYGEGGLPGGPEIILNLSVPGRVSFEYNHKTHIVAYTITPDTVVIPGSFQSELGCGNDQTNVGGDWEPACDATRLTWDGVDRVWTGTFDIPAGNWWYKVAINNSWIENYGQYGIPGGPDIPLNLELPARITFTYNPVTHLVTLVYKTTYLCVNAFYDANANGYRDWWSENTPLEGISIALTDGSTVTQLTGSDGKACFGNLSPGLYTIKGIASAGYLPTLDSLLVYVGDPQTFDLGMACTGSAGARNFSFWMNKQGQVAFDALPDWQQSKVLGMLQYLNLRNADGSDYDPGSFEELRNWLQHANAKNIAYKLSAQMAVLYLNAEIGNLDDRAIYTPGINYWGYQRDFMNVNTVIWYVNQQLFENSYGGDASRTLHKSLSKMLEDANADKTYVQLQPCGSHMVTSAKKGVVEEGARVTPSAVIWPNPSGSHFNLRLSAVDGNGDLQVRVLDVQGKLLYSATGPAGKAYQFGEGFKPGLYFVEITHGENRSTIKVVKQ